ncbi:probable ATP-dependent DNA helicase HFM1 [Pecten maximus]|uniref:probable ATP-dependent DNA helicase HFM1 n=1 Tax=Pecten maximus TaxID=6579 RepID=UPI001458B53E|nr:probable ATP-dependent DNA helicase HFM1 [Pecten maximus]
MELSQLFYQPSYNFSQKRTQLSQAPASRSQYIDIPEAPVASDAPVLPPVFQESFDFQPSQLFKHSSKEIRENKTQGNLHADEIISSKNRASTITRPSFVTPVKSHDISHDADIGSDEDLFDSGAERVRVLPIKDKLFTPAPLILPNPHPNCNGIKLRPVEELPMKYRSIFKAFPYFNIVQSKVFDDVFYTDKPLVVCAPTGAGKTVVFELAIVRLLMKMQSVMVRGFKVVYMAPIKALCSERLQDWTAKFEAFGLKCKELTGDTEIDDYYELQEVNVILTTPEKWDSMTRRWRDNKCIVQSVCLFFIDEIHVLNDCVRGATIEAVISRMKTVQISLCHSNTEQQLPKLRFIAVSATIPNIEDIAEWMGESHHAKSNIAFWKCSFFKDLFSVLPQTFFPQDFKGKFLINDFRMDDSFRPVRLRKVVLGFPFDEHKGSGFHFDMSLSYKLGGIINTYSDGKPALVFCSTRKGTQQAADILAKDSRSTYIKDAKNRQVLLKYSNLVKDAKLRDTLVKGIGVHHAGMDIQDRKYIEELFATSQLQVLVATSTLAMGVNLPAHLVILKSTQHYNMGMLEEYSNTQVLQMIGRAGRPQFDTTATAVIMTKVQNKLKYESLLNGTQMIESSLHKHLIEHLNAEIVLQTISDMAIAMEWIRHTYLYIRVMKNPKHYGMPLGLTRDQTETKLQELCMRNLNQLAGIQMIKMNGETFDIQSTEAGRLMARYCIAFETMKKFCGVSGEESISDLLEIVAGSEEFMEIQLRVNEKKTLNALNKDKNRQTIRYQLQGKIKTKQMKVNCLMQAQLGCLLVQDFALQQDTTRIFRAAQRLSRCLMEVLWIRDDYQAFLSAAQLCKAIKAKLWENSKHVAKQLERIGPALSTALVNAGITSFQKIEETNPRDLELIVNRHPPFGNQVRDSVTYLPKYELTMEQVSRYNIDTAEILLHLSIANQANLMTKKTASPNHTCILLVANNDNKIIFRRKLMDSYLLKESGFTKKFEVQRAAIGPELFIHLISQDWVGLDVETTYSPYYLGATRISNVPSKVDGGNPQLNSGGRPPGGQTPGGLRPCNHRCYNKSLCGHKCCNSMTKTKPQPTPIPKTPAITKTKTGSICSYISGLKNKLTMLPNTPSAKRIKINSDGNSFNINQFAYTPKRPDSMVPSEDGYNTSETIEQFNSDGSSEENCPSMSTSPGVSITSRPQYSDVKLVSPDTKVSRQAKIQVQDEQQKTVTKPQYNSWAQLDLYQKRREEYMKDADNFQQEDDYDLPELGIRDSPQVPTTIMSQMRDEYGSFGITSSLFPSRIPSPHRMAYHTKTHPDGTLSYDNDDDFEDNPDYQTSGGAFDKQGANLPFIGYKSRTSVQPGTRDNNLRKRTYPYPSEDKDVVDISEGEVLRHSRSNPYTQHRFGQVVAWSNFPKSCPVTPKQQRSQVILNRKRPSPDELGEEDPWSGSDNDLLMLEDSTGIFRPASDDKKSKTGTEMICPDSNSDSLAQLVRPKLRPNKTKNSLTSKSETRQGDQAHSRDNDVQNSDRQDNAHDYYGKGDRSYMYLQDKSQSNSCRQGLNTRNISPRSGNNKTFNYRPVSENTQINPYKQGNMIQSNSSRSSNIQTSNYRPETTLSNPYKQGNMIQSNSSRSSNIQTSNYRPETTQSNPYKQGNMIQSNSSRSSNIQTSNYRPETTQSNPYKQGNMIQSNSSRSSNIQTSNYRPENTQSNPYVQGNRCDIQNNSSVGGDNSRQENIRSIVPAQNTQSNIYTNKLGFPNSQENFQNHRYESTVQGNKFQSNALKPAEERILSKITQQLKMADSLTLPASNNSGLSTKPKPIPPPMFRTASFFTTEDQAISDSPQETFNSIFDGIF